MIEFFTFDELGSTQDKAFELIEGQDLAYVVVEALHQSNGRATKSRSWYSEPGKSLCWSLAWRPKKKNLSGLSLLVGLSLLRSIGREDLKVKWPNDVMLGDHKVGGVLIETRTQGSGFIACIGVGLNLHRFRASEFQSLNQSLQVRKLAEALISDISVFEEKGFSPFKADFESRMWRKAEKVWIRLSEPADDSEMKQVRLEGVSDQGYLCVEEGGQVFSLNQAEIVLGDRRD